MKTVNVHEAKTHLSRLVEEAANGEAFVIAKAGRPMVKVVPLEEVPAEEPKKACCCSPRTKPSHNTTARFASSVSSQTGPRRRRSG
ncbi:prevent-host-death family protein [Neorhizobium galegae]|nr:prevent-host-death family protein [Neorhizobium galegae]